MPCNRRHDAVLFDFDGTLADTQRDVWVSLRHAAERVGGTFSPQVMDNPVNLSLSMEALLSMLEPPVAPEKLPLFDRETTRHYRTINPMRHTQLYPGIEPLLQELHAANIPCCIATMKPAGALANLLAAKGWTHWFHRCVSPDSLCGEPLTKARMIGLLLHLLDAKHPVYIGDSASDVCASKKNDLPVIAVTYGDGDTAALLEAGPDHVAHSAAEIAAILRGV